MTILVFEHEGWEVATTSWTAAAKPGKGVTICYEWGADRWAWNDNSVSTARVTFAILMSEFISAIKGKDYVEIRSAKSR